MYVTAATDIRVLSVRLDFAARGIRRATVSFGRGLARLVADEW